jgi:hypothetical protein
MGIKSFLGGISKMAAIKYGYLTNFLFISFIAIDFCPMEFWTCINFLILPEKEKDLRTYYCKHSDR